MVGPFTRVGLSLGVALALHAWLVLAAPRMKAPKAAQAHAVSMAFEVTASPRVERQAERSREVDVRAPRLVASMSKAVARPAQAASYGSTGPEAQQAPRSASNSAAPASPAPADVRSAAQPGEAPAPAEARGPGEARAPADVGKSTVAQPTAAAAASAVVQPAAAATAAATARTTLDLSPLAAARSVACELSTAPADAGPPRNEGEARSEVLLADGIPGLVREPHGVAGAGVNNLAHDAVGAAMRPWDVFRKPLADGRYRYRGVGFDAIIRADGTVAYRDRDGVHLGVAASVAPAIEAGGLQEAKSEPVPTIGLGDPRTWVARIAGNDPHAAERRAFLARTQELRELLRARAERAHAERAGANQQRQLARILAGGGERADKQQAIFALWEQCSEDEVGAQARSAIEDFVRTHCPPEGECGFAAADLERLNRQRGRGMRFDPYATPDAGS